jgi:(2Fe-2S) ferredoxin
VFFCLNVRTAINGEPPRACCGGDAASAAQQHAKKRIKSLGLSQAGKVRINQAGCLERCEQGPCLVVYPQGTWYTYLDKADIDDIIDQHLLGGKVVQRLQLPALANRVDSNPAASNAVATNAIATNAMAENATD